MLNARTVRSVLVEQLKKRGASEADIVSKHMIACSANVEGATAFGINPDNVFGFWNWVGGRYR